MINIISQLFPHTKIMPSSKFFCHNGLISINIDEQLLFIEISYDELPSLMIQELENILISQYRMQTKIHFIECVEFDKSNNNKLSFNMAINNQELKIILSLDTLTFFAKAFNLIRKNYLSSTIFDLYRELFRFSPKLIQETSWKQFEDKKLENLFNQMLTGQLATLHMLALFFQKIGLASPIRFFSKRTAQELKQELHKLSDSENKNLLESIYYIIERNILLLFLENSAPILSELEYHNTFLIYHKYFLYESIKNFHLNSLKCIQTFQSQIIFPTFIQKIPYFSLVTFLKLSPSDNLQIIKNGFSHSGFNMLINDIINTPEQIFSYRILLKQLAFYEYKALGLTFEKALKKYITIPRDWEFLAREVDLRELLIALDSLEEIPKTLSGIIDTTYRIYKTKEIIFPNIQKIILSKALESCTVNILYLKFLNLLQT